jgi:hypothetical protein
MIEDEDDHIDRIWLRRDWRARLAKPFMLLAELNCWVFVMVPDKIARVIAGDRHG